MDTKIKVLFVCVHNAARSQMAEAFLNELGGGRFIAESAGFEPTALNPLAVRVMQEAGIDISAKRSKSVFDLYLQGRLYNYVITVCDEASAEKCPTFPGFARKLHWSFEDPATFTGGEAERLEQARKLRDRIRFRVEAFIAEHRDEAG
jgi:arsenate reductase